MSHEGRGMLRREAKVWIALALWSCASATAQPPRRSLPVITLAGETSEFFGAALAEAIRALPSDSAPVCVTLRGAPPAIFYRPPPLLLVSLQTDSHRVVASPDCPPTYDLMSVLRDSSGRDITPVRPPGYIDPHVLVVDQYELAGADSVSFRAVAHQGTLNRHFRCGARRGVNGVWQARCEFLGQTMSALPPNETLQLTSARVKESLRFPPVEMLVHPHW